MFSGGKPASLHVGDEVGGRITSQNGSLLLSVSQPSRNFGLGLATEGQRHVLVHADAARAQQPQAFAQHAVARRCRDLVHRVVRDDQVEVSVREGGRAAIHLVEVHRDAERLGARVRIAQCRCRRRWHAPGIREGDRIRHAGRAGGAAHVEDPARLQVREALRDVALHVRGLAVVLAEALAEGVEVAATLVERAGRNVATAEVHRIAAGLQVDVDRGDARAGTKAGSSVRLPRRRAGSVSSRALAASLSALTEDAVADGDPHLLLRGARQRRPAAIRGIAEHRLAHLVARGRGVPCSRDHSPAATLSKTSPMPARKPRFSACLNATENCWRAASSAVACGSMSWRMLRTMMCDSWAVVRRAVNLRG